MHLYSCQLNLLCKYKNKIFRSFFFSTKFPLLNENIEYKKGRTNMKKLRTKHECPTSQRAQKTQLYNTTCIVKPSKRNRRGRDEESPTTCSIDTRFGNTRQGNNHRLPPVPEKGTRRRNSTTSTDEPEKKPLNQSNPHHERRR